MLYKYVKRTRDFWGRFYFYFSLVFSILGAFLIKNIQFGLVGYEIIIANSALRATLALYLTIIP